EGDGHIAAVEQLAERNAVEARHERARQERAAGTTDGRADAGEFQRASDTLEVASNQPRPDDTVGAEVACLLDDARQRSVARGHKAILVGGVLPVEAPAVVGAHAVPVRARVSLQESDARGDGSSSEGPLADRHETRIA